MVNPVPVRQHVIRCGRYWIFFKFAFDDADQGIEVGGVEVGDGALEQRPHPRPGSARAHKRATGKRAASPCSRRRSPPVSGPGARSKVVPAPHQRRAELLMRRDDQVPVGLPGERLRLTAPAM